MRLVLLTVPKGGTQIARNTPPQWKTCIIFKRQIILSLKSLFVLQKVNMFLFHFLLFIVVFIVKGTT